MKRTNSALLVFLCLGLLFQTMRSSAQEILDGFDDETSSSRKGQFYMIPELSLYFGLVTNIEAAPQIAYHLSERWSLGLGPHYIFYKTEGSYYSTDAFKSHIWGAKLFSRYTIIREAADLLPFYLFDDLFIHAEYEWMSLENKYFNAPYFTDDGRFGLDSYYLGAGICQNFSSRSGYYLMVLWNLNQTMNSFYHNPMYRFGINLYFR